MVWVYEPSIYGVLCEPSIKTLGHAQLFCSRSAGRPTIQENNEAWCPIVNSLFPSILKVPGFDSKFEGSLKWQQDETLGKNQKEHFCVAIPHPVWSNEASTKQQSHKKIAKAKQCCHNKITKHWSLNAGWWPIVNSQISLPLHTPIHFQVRLSIKKLNVYSAQQLGRQLDVDDDAGGEVETSQGLNFALWPF